MTMQLPFFSSVGTPGTPEQIKQCQDNLPGNSKRTNKVSTFPHYNDYQKLIIQLKKSEASPNKEWLSCTIPASFCPKESNNDQAIRFVAKSQHELDFLLMSTNNLKKVEIISYPPSICISSIIYTWELQNGFKFCLNTLI